ncbi:MAG: DUF1553 domain-containing protein [Pirellulaceae bacterium]
MLIRPFSGCLLLALSLPAGLLAAEPVDYARQVKPILRQHCFSCHGPLKQEAGLRLDAGRSILQGGESGKAVVAGRAEQSLLMERLLQSDVDLRMPLEEQPLVVDQVELIRRWIEEGAAFPREDQADPDPRDHWFFQLPVRSPLPRGVARDWREHPVDRFIAAGHKAARVRPVSLAAPEQLIRRVYLDLVGLPPTREELHQFLADPSPAAYGELIDRLLDDPRYGERWGRHWMDVWRYSDWYGRREVNDVRNSFPHIWRWRDWIINSLNEDKGYDQMIREMLAADELYPADDERIVATGFIVRNWFSLNYDTWMRDLVEHTGKAFLGLRMNCALCHDHKYDPITQEDYFRFRAFFEPLEVRNDRVPGGPDVPKYIRYKPGSGASLKPGGQGLARIYDYTLDATTRMYRLGDQRDLFEEREPVEPGIPGFLGELSEAISIIELPPEAHYPGSKRFVQQAEVQSRQQTLELATSEAVKVQAQKQPMVAAAQLELKQAQAVLAETLQQPPPVESTVTLRGELIRQATAFWDFEPQGPDGDFGKDRSGHGHDVVILADGSASVSLLGSDKWPADSALHDLPGERKNTAAVVFRHGSGQAMLQAAASTEFLSSQFTATAVIRLDRSEAGLVQAVMGTDRHWALVVEGVDEAGGLLKVLSWSAEGEQVMAPGQEESQRMPLQVGEEYFVGVVAGEGQCHLILRALEGDQPPVVRQGPVATQRATAGETDLRIGDLDGSAWWHGLIDDVGFWNRALTLQQLAALAGTTGVSEELVEARQAVQRARIGLARIELPVVVAGKKQQAAEAELAAIKARVDADESRYRAVQTKGATSESLAGQAARLEKVAKVTRLEASVAAQELMISELEGKEVQDDKGKKDLAAAKTSLPQIRKELEQAQQQAGTVASNYTPLSPTYPRQSTGRRRALAGWITDRQNPLTARVAVNHIWMRHFGRPLVESVMDLGVSGKQPTHPQLLDWLAVELMEQGWSMKHLHRLILTSRTYRLQTGLETSSGVNLERDKDNRWWWKMDDRRMESEIVRDSILAVSGQLDPTLGGPVQDPAQADTILRRSLYFSIYPEGGGQIELLGLFDPPDPCDCYQRSSSVVPQQSLALVNSRLVLDQSRRLARQLVEEVFSGGMPAEKVFIQAAFEQVLSRRPASNEMEVCRAFLEKQAVLFREADLAGEITPEGHVAPSKDPAMRARESLVRALFSHNDFITIH